MFQLILAIFCAYLTGSVPTSYIAGRLIKGIDIRQHGSGNAGATNTFRVIGKGPGIIVLIIDIFKGFFAVYFLPKIFNVSAMPINSGMLEILLGAAVISGHIWTVFLKFRGGKGVATGAGVLIGLNPIAFGIGAIIWVIVTSITRVVAIGSICACLGILIYMICIKAPIEYIIFVSIAVMVIILKHVPNIKKLLGKGVI